jgi:hypothetical protein
MGRFLTGVLHVELLLAATLSGALIVSANSVEPLTLETAASSPPECSSPEIVVYEENERPSSEGPCAVPPRTAAELSEARAYLIATAVPGYTMTRQGPELAIGRLHPEFASRLASAIKEARSVGLAEAGIFSAYRPPAFGVGGFVDKFESLHTYGLAVDMRGIGAAGSPEAHLWHAIAAKHGVICPYGPDHPIEWNHCQPTHVKIILAENPLRATVTPDGPSKLEGMFELGTSVIDPPLSPPSDLSTLITKVQEARLHPKQQAIPQPRPSVPPPRTDKVHEARLHPKQQAIPQPPPPRVDKKSAIPSLSGSGHHIGFKQVARAQAIPYATATDGLRIISVEEGRRTLRARSIHATKSQ